MAEAEIYIWDVERGDAILVKGPKRNAILDLGSHRSGFSPCEHIRRNHGVKDIDYLVISHPDADHISDLPRFVELYDPSVIATRDEALPYIRRRKDELYPDDEEYQTIVQAYLNLTTQYTNPPKYSPRSADWNGGLTIHHEMLPSDQIGVKPVSQLSSDETVNLNNLSIVSILRYGSFQMVTMGDLESNAIEKLLSRDGVTEKLKRTNVLLAPHHGRESSYTSELLHYCNPDVVAISDAKAGATNASSKYSTYASGITVGRRNGGTTRRNVVTTRNDGVISIRIDDNSWSVRID